jgi:hypothetical protein
VRRERGRIFAAGNRAGLHSGGRLMPVPAIYRRVFHRFRRRRFRGRAVMMRRDGAGVAAAADAGGDGKCRERGRLKQEQSQEAKKCRVSGKPPVWFRVSHRMETATSCIPRQPAIYSMPADFERPRRIP